MSNVGTATFSNNIVLGSDSAKLRFGADKEVELIHQHDVGLRLNSDNHFQFGDAER